MEPQLCVPFLVADLKWLAHEDALEHLSNISEVECVMELGGDRQHSFLYLQVHVNGSLNSYACLQLIAGFLDGEEPVEDLLKDESQSFFSGLRHIDDLEVAHKAGCKRLPTAAGRRCSTHDGEALDLAPAKVRTIVETVHVNQLSKKLDGRLSAIELFLGHVHIIDEDEELGIALHAPYLLALSHELTLDISLRTLALGLSRKV